MATCEEFVRQLMARRGVQPELDTADVQKLVDDLDAYGRLSFENGFRRFDLRSILANA